MKKIIALIMFATLSVGVFCQIPQTVEKEKMKVTPPRFAVVENSETFLEGQEFQSLADYVVRNFEYPEVRSGTFYEGTEVVQFVVSPMGEVTDIKVINSVSHEIDAEIIRIIESTNGKWVPGTSDDKPVAMTQEFSLMLKWDETDRSGLEEEFQKIAQDGFKHAGELWFTKHKPKRALNCYNRCIRYRPHDELLLLMRGLCRYELGDTEGARADWCRYRDLGGTVDCEAAWFAAEKKDEMKGYKEMVNVVKEKK
jgi:hypothetical protein